MHGVSQTPGTLENKEIKYLVSPGAVAAQTKNQKSKPDLLNIEVEDSNKMVLDSNIFNTLDSVHNKTTDYMGTPSLNANGMTQKLQDSESTQKQVITRTTVPKVTGYKKIASKEDYP